MINTKTLSASSSIFGLSSKWSCNKLSSRQCSLAQTLPEQYKQYGHNKITPGGDPGEKAAGVETAVDPTCCSLGRLTNLTCTCTPHFTRYSEICLLVFYTNTPMAGDKRSKVDSVTVLIRS